MKKKFNITFALITLLTVCSTLALAAEPTNLAVYKQELKRYHDSGAYIHDIRSVTNHALNYLQQRLASKAPKKPAIILDIDETSLSNYADMERLGFGGTLAEIRADEDKGIDPPIEPTLKLYQFAKDKHVAIFFLSGRFEYERQTTIDNLRTAGYQHWDGIILRSEQYAKVSAATYKAAMRKQLAEQGYNIILSLGDQKSDFVGGYADKTFKLPNPYYFIP